MLVLKLSKMKHSKCFCKKGYFCLGVLHITNALIQACYASSYSVINKVHFETIGQEETEEY